MYRPHAGRALGNPDDIVKGLEDEVLRLKEQLLSAKGNCKVSEDENQVMRQKYNKMLTLVKGERQNIESIPARLLAPDKGVENFIHDLQGKVQQLKKKNRTLLDSNTKLKEKSKTAGRGVLPRYLNRKTIKVPEPIHSSPIQQVNSATIGTSPRIVNFSNVHTSPRTVTPLAPSSLQQSHHKDSSNPPPFALDSAGQNRSYVHVQHLVEGDLGNINRSEYPPPQQILHDDQITDSRINQLLSSSEAAIQEKSSVISHLESLVIALKDKLIESEQAILEQRDCVLSTEVERDTAVKNRDISYRERDLLVSERDHAVSMKIKIEKNTTNLEQELSSLQQDRSRIREELDTLTDRHRKERSRWEDNEGTRLETLDSLSKTLKEKTAALVILDNKYRDLEDKSSKLTSTNLDMLQEMESLHHQLNRHRISQRDQELELIRLKCEGESSTASVEQYNRLREEYLILQKEHSVAVDRILETRNITEQQVRSEHTEEVSDLKKKIVKWEAASKSQFLEHHKDLLRIQQLEEKHSTSEAAAASLTGQLQASNDELELHKQKISLLLQAKSADGVSVLDGTNLKEVMAALELVKRSQGMKTMTDMVKEFTKEEREDVLITQKNEIDSLKRELTVLTSNNKQLKAQLETLAHSADDHIARMGNRVKEVEKTQQKNQKESEAILNVQTAQISSLVQTIQRKPSKAESVMSTLTLDSDVGDDNILQVSLGVCQFFSNIQSETVAVALDFFTFETVATIDTFRIPESGPSQPTYNFDTHFIFRLSGQDGSDLNRYLHCHNSTLSLTSNNGNIKVGNALLNCSQLIGLSGRISASGRISLRDSVNTGKTIGFIDVELRLKKPLPEEWIRGEHINEPLDGIRQDVVIPGSVSVSRQIEIKNNLDDVIGIRVEIADLSLITSAKVSIYCCVCGVDVWFIQSEGEPTKNPTFTLQSHLQSISPPTSRDEMNLLQQPIPFVLFDDTKQEVTDCIGSTTFSPIPLLQGAHCKASGPVNFFDSSRVDVGTLFIKLTWQLKDE